MNKPPQDSQNVKQPTSSITATSQSQPVLAANDTNLQSNKNNLQQSDKNEITATTKSNEKQNPKEIQDNTPTKAPIKNHSQPPLRTYQKIKKQNVSGPITKLHQIQIITRNTDKEDKHQLPKMTVQHAASLKLADQNEAMLKDLTEQIRSVAAAAITAATPQPATDNIPTHQLATTTPIISANVSESQPVLTLSSKPSTKTSSSLLPTKKKDSSSKESNQNINKARQNTGTSRQRLQFSCAVCSFETTRKSHFSRHIAFHHANPDMEILKCEDCAYSTTRISCLKHHIAVNHAAGRL